MRNLEAGECVRRAETIGRPLVSAAFPRLVLEPGAKRSQPPPSARPQAEGEVWSGSWLFEEQHRLVEAGFGQPVKCPAATPMILQLSIHPSGTRTCYPDRLGSPSADAFLSRSFRQSGRPRRRSGRLVTFSDRFVIQDSGEPDEHHPKRGRRRSPTFPTTRSVPGIEPLLRQRPARRFRLVAVRKAVGRCPVCAGDLRFRPRQNEDQSFL